MNLYGLPQEVLHAHLASMGYGPPADFDAPGVPIDDEDPVGEPSPPPRHPAPFSAELMPAIADLLEANLEIDHVFPPLVLDPFAGIGRIHALREHGFTTVGVELEEEWAKQSAFEVETVDPNPSAASRVMGKITMNHTRVGNALDLPFYDDSFDAVVTSPAFGNRMADSHEARDGSHRRTYRHYLGRELSGGNSGTMQWGDGPSGDAYRNFHSEAWNEVRRVLVPGGVFILNIKDHQRKKRRAHVSNWHYGCLRSLGFELADVRRVATPGYRYGENREVRYPERLLVFRNRKAAPAALPRFSRPPDTSMTFDTDGFPVAA